MTAVRSAAVPHVGASRAIGEEEAAARSAVASAPVKSGWRAFRIVWIATNALLIASLLGAIWSSAWEYSTRRYLQGFSDAVIPFSSAPMQKVQAIINWMAHSPERIDQAPQSLADDRNPTDTLNYASLLKVCGTATNAFINLAASGGLTARRLLLLDQNNSTMHVVAEVLVDGRWIIVDPAFRSILRGPDGNTVTHEDMLVPATFAYATSHVPGYDPAYVYDHAVHLRMSRVGVAGRVIRRVLNAILPGWEGSAALSLIVERESLGMTILFTLAALLFLLLRSILRWYAESRLGFRPDRFRRRLYRLGQLLFEPVE
jgi:hypothetical protein